MKALRFADGVNSDVAGKKRVFIRAAMNVPVGDDPTGGGAFLEVPVKKLPALDFEILQ